MFDIEKLTAFAVDEIEKFALEHQSETFYAFAIDASLLCLNSVERFEETLIYWRDKWEADNTPLDIATLSEKESQNLLNEVAEYIEDAASTDSHGLPLTLEEMVRFKNEIRSANRRRGNPYLTRLGIKEFRDNTGNWHYQGFAHMEDRYGFDHKAYGKHYDMTDSEQKTSAYGKAMDTLLDQIRLSGVLARLNRTDGFQIFRVEHDY